MGLALWLELRDKAIRTEGDVVAVLELPTLVSVPWIGTQPNGGGYAKRAAEDKREKVEV
jgi:hypothetical protein